MGLGVRSVILCLKATNSHNDKVVGFVLVNDEALNILDTMEQ